jgi:hypothetical protein
VAQQFPKVWAQIYARLSADSGLLSLLQTTAPGQPAPIYNTIAPEAAGFPYVLYNIESNLASDAFNARVRELVFQVHTYVQEQLSSADPWQRISDIDARITGDWPQQASRLPTYGLDRWTMTLTGSGWVADMCGLLDSTPANELGVFHTIHRFRVLCTEVGV